MKHAVRLFKLMRRFGLREGASLFLLHARHQIRPSLSRPVSIKLKQFPLPITLRPATSDWVVFEKIFVDLEYDLGDWPRHARAMANCASRLKALSRTPLIVDCGANIGLTSIWYAHLYPDARIIAIEPEPDNFALLAKNVSGYPNIKPIMAAVSDHTGRVSLTNDGTDPWAWRVEEDQIGETALTTIPEVLAQEPGSALFIVKIDIEGAEEFLFRSNTDWAVDVPLIVFESHDWLFPGRGTAHAILSRLVEQRRDYLQKGENTFSLACTLFAFGSDGTMLGQSSVDSRPDPIFHPASAEEHEPRQKVPSG